MHLNPVSSFILILVHHLFSVELVSSQTNDIIVSAFYETQCPDSMKFIVDEVLPSFKELGKYFSVRFVPFGKAKMDYHSDEDLWYFTCQHGNDECYYNMIHACALSKIQNSDARIGYIACLMSTKNENSVLKKCSDMFNVDLDDIKHCVHETKDGNHLLAGYGNETLHFFPDGLSFVPTITVNGVYLQNDETEALKNLQRVVCKYINFFNNSLPAGCKNYYSLDNN